MAGACDKSISGVRRVVGLRDCLQGKSSSGKEVSGVCIQVCGQFTEGAVAAAKVGACSCLASSQPQYLCSGPNHATGWCCVFAYLVVVERYVVTSWSRCVCMTCEARRSRNTDHARASCSMKL